MAVIIANLTEGDFADENGLADYEVRVNRGPVLARFRHRRDDGLAACLKRAAEAVEGAMALADGSTP